MRYKSQYGYLCDSLTYFFMQLRRKVYSNCKFFENFVFSLVTTKEHKGNVYVVSSVPIRFGFPSGFILYIYVSIRIKNEIPSENSWKIL